MKFLTKAFGVLYFSIFTLLLLTEPAYAYIDPAATSYVVQIIAGLFISIGVVTGVFWKKIQYTFKAMKIKAMERKLTAQVKKQG